MTGPSAPMEGAREAPLSDVEMVLYNHYRHLGCPGTVDPADPEDCASVAVESIRALSSAGYTLVPTQDIRTEFAVDHEGGVPVSRMQSASQAQEVASTIGARAVQRLVAASPWVPVSGEGQQ